MRVEHRPPEEQHVQHALLEAVDDGFEQVQVAECADVGGDVAAGQPPPVRRAEHEVVLERHRLDVAGRDLVTRAEQAVPVQRDPRRRGRASRCSGTTQ